MRFRIVPSVILMLFFSIFPLRRDVRLPAIMDEISVDDLKRHVTALHFDRSPYGHDPGPERAVQYIQREILKLGLDVKEDFFEWEGKSYRNLIAEKKGAVYPERIFIVGAHYDTVPGSPGADDNASAIAVLLEVARCIQKMSLDSTIRLIAFDLEEYGFVGSTHYAEKAKRAKEKVLGMISLEMVGYTHPKQNYPPYLNAKDYPHAGDFIGIIGNERSREFLERVYASFKRNIPQLPVESLLTPGNGEGMEEATLSDHSPFWDRGFPALMITDTAFLRNPNYHLPSDTLETLDFEFMRKVAAGVYYSIVDLAK